MLVAAGADIHARSHGQHQTPPHCAAGCDDMAVLDALLDAGADIDAAAFAQWNVAFRLVERGAATTLVTAATLGLLDREQTYFAGPDTPTQAEINAAFGGACHGGHRPTAEFLVRRGADTNWVPSWQPMAPLDSEARSGTDGLAPWLRTGDCASRGSQRNEASDTCPSDRDQGSWRLPRPRFAEHSK
jgi:ankyrin repeat protein